MLQPHRARPLILLALACGLSACGGGGGVGNVTFGGGAVDPATTTNYTDPLAKAQASAGAEVHKSTIWDNFSGAANPNITVLVNKYLWKASLEVLDFLPVESVDPFTGVIVTGYGAPPGGGKAYRATIYIQDGALDARSLHVSLQTKGGGTVSTETERAVEDAILSRARQLRIADAGY